MDSHLLSHLKELAARASSQEVITASPFLDLPSQGELLRQFHEEKLFETRAFFFGGCNDAERARLIFLPSYLDKESFIESEISSSEYIVCLQVTPIGKKFAVPLSHRDYLGAILGLGIKRETLGDLRFEDNEARVYALPNIATYIEENLRLVKTEVVSVERIPLFSPGFTLHFEEVTLSVSSYRLDALLSEAYPLSRGLAKKHIEAGNVTHNGEIATAGDAEIKLGDVISLRGKGKIRLMGEEGTSRKGRILMVIRRYL